MRRFRALVAASALAMSLTAQDVLIKDLAKILTAESGVLENASILVRAGRIAALGRNLTAPEGATIIDGTGLVASPGIIDAHSHLAVTGGLNEGTHIVTPEVRIADVLDPEDPHIRTALAGGVTTAHILHGSANAIGGQCAVIKLKWNATAAEMLVKDAPRTVKFALGENPTRANSGGRASGHHRFPSTRMGVEAVLREAFDGAIAYRNAWRDYESAKAGEIQPLPPARDLRKEALLDILEGRLLIHCHCYRADEILMILELAKSYGFKIQALHHVLEGYKVAPEIAAAGTGASTFADWWAFKLEAYDAVPYNAAIMARAGVLVSINSDSADHIRRLNVEAAKCVKYGGLTDGEALRLVTLNPAKQLKIDHRTGSLAEGKDADIVLWNGDPLSSFSRAELTMIEGVVHFDRKADLAARVGTRRLLHPEGGR